VRRRFCEAEPRTSSHDLALAAAVGVAGAAPFELAGPSFAASPRRTLARLLESINKRGQRLSSVTVPRVHVLTDDLLFGSRLQGDLGAAGYEVALGPAADRTADAIVADLTHDADTRIAALAAPRPPVLAYFAHVEPDVRERALAAGIELVVPRSRIAREGPALLAGLLATAR
jgi:hypothetical protein